MREDWIECKLGDILFVNSGKGLSVNKMKTGKNPVYGGNGISGFHSEFIYEDIKLIIGRVGAKCGVVHITHPRAWVTDNALVVNFYFENPNLKFFKLLLEIENLNKLSNSTAQPVISGAKIYDYNIYLPPFPEQCAIVKKIETLFSSLDAGIADLKKSQEQLKIYRQAVLKKAFEGELTKNRKKGNIERIKLKEVLTISSQKHKPEKEEILFYVGLEHIEKHTGKLINSVKLETITTIKNKFFPNQILYGKLRPYLNKVYLSKEEGVCSTDILVFNISEKINPKFIHLFMMGREFVNNMSNNTSGVNLPRVPTKYIENYLIPFTSLEEQQQIVKEIESRLSVCDDLEKQIKNNLDQAEALRQSILKKAFEGNLLTEEELRACKAEPDYEPASVLLQRIKAEKEAHKPVKKTSKKKVS
ncbi:restriction endonuclease subunit S [Chryseobacterium arthrosphaerae]|uniref:restriction endonuclease subunit S n=1 Tax=Chryseobacterium arthrosphaerae TaxID=651561 RepID=UPI003D347631